MRGKGQFPQFYFSQIGITPAYAGKSGGANPRNHVPEDHPRLCGEKCLLLHFLWCRLGSPPPMRGKVGHAGENHVEFGITPAYAGKSCECAGDLSNLEDHPRLCGEKRKDCGKLHRNTGSPPPMRGKAISSLCEIMKSRITPAYAGKSP